MSGLKGQDLDDLTNYPPTPANDFARAYNAWVKLRIEEVRLGSLDIRALKAFKNVEKAFKQLKSSLDY